MEFQCKLRRGFAGILPAGGESIGGTPGWYMGVPPPILWTQNPCFLEVTRRVALQNIENKEVPCKIFQDKELRTVSEPIGRFWLKNGLKRTCRTHDLKEDF
jgi:hypothetical protein